MLEGERQESDAAEAALTDRTVVTEHKSIRSNHRPRLCDRIPSMTAVAQLPYTTELRAARILRIRFGV
jgi:hypothetical protein